MRLPRTLKTVQRLAKTQTRKMSGWSHRETKKGRTYVRPPCLRMEPAQVPLPFHAGPQAGLDPSIGRDTRTRPATP